MRGRRGTEEGGRGGERRMRGRRVGGRGGERRMRGRKGEREKEKEGK